MKNKRKTIISILIIIFAVIASLLYVFFFQPSSVPRTVSPYLQEYLSEAIENKHVWVIEKISKEDESQSTYTIKDTNEKNIFFLSNPSQIGASDLVGKKITIEGIFKMNDKSSEGRLKDMSAVVLEVNSFEIIE